MNSIYIWIIVAAVIVAIPPIIAGALAFNIWLGKFIDRMYRQQLIGKCFETEVWLEENLEDIVYITGNRGAGKSALAAGFANYATFKKKKMAIKRVEDLTLRLGPKLDLAAIDELIATVFWDEEKTNTDAVLNYVKKHNKGARLLRGKDYYDYLYPAEFEDELRDYCAAQIALIKNNYVIDTQGSFWSQITNNYSYTYDPKAFDIRESFRTKKWQFLPYSIILDDDRNTQVGNSSERGSPTSGLSSGKSATYRLNRHLFKGKLSGNTYITTSQRFKRSPEGQRESALSVFSVEKLQTGLGMPWKNSYIQLKIDNKDYFFKGRRRKKPINPAKAYARLRQDDRQLKRDFADGFTVFTVLVYGNNLEAADEHGAAQVKRLYFPTRYIFKAYPTYYYAFIERKLSKLALDNLDKGQWRAPDDMSGGLSEQAQDDSFDSIVNVNHFTKTMPQYKPRAAKEHANGSK